MTTKEKLKKMLTECGMSDSEADDVLKEVIPRIESLMPGITWDRPANEYPDALYNDVMWLPLRDAALKWIDKNAPQAWFRSMFE